MCLKCHWNFEHANLTHENFKKFASICKVILNKNHDNFSFMFSNYLSCYIKI